MNRVQWNGIIRMNAEVIVFNLHLGILRSSFSSVYCRINLLKNFANAKRKHILPSVATLQLVALLKKTLCHKCFPVSFVKAFEITWSQSTLGELLLKSAGQLTLQNKQNVCSLDISTLRYNIGAYIVQNT